MAAQVILDKFSTFESRNRLGLSFNAFVPTTEGDKQDGFLIRGLRLMGGMVYAPAAKLGVSLQPLNFYPYKVAQGIYEALVESRKAEELGIELLPEDFAISNLLVSRKEAMQALPQEWEKVQTV